MDDITEEVYQAIIGYTGARSLEASKSRAYAAAREVLPIINRLINDARRDELKRVKAGKDTELAVGIRMARLAKLETS